VGGHTGGSKGCRGYIGVAEPSVDEEGKAECVEVDTRRVRVEEARDFGGSWLGREISEKLGLIPNGDW
jgi:hypothetical protein